MNAIPEMPQFGAPVSGSTATTVPAKSPTSDVALSIEQGGTLVARGLVAVRDFKAQQLSLSPEANVERLFQLGMRYRYGEDGVEADDDKARKYFLQAADRNHAEAQYELAVLLDNNGEQDEAVRWMTRSASLDFGPALSDLADNPSLSEQQRYELLLKARAWYLTRATTGNAEWQFEYARLLFEKPLYRGDKEDGFRWLKASAEQNYRHACIRLGDIYLHDEVTEHTTEQGIYWLSRAADLGIAFACGELGDLYLQGHCDSDAKRRGRQPHMRLTPDKQKAIAWYERGIEMGARWTAYRLGTLYLKGELLDQNLPLAEKWLLRSANDGYNSAMVLLGTEYASGARLRQDANAALHWLAMATKSLPRTCVKIAEIYLDGKILPKNFDEAIKWLNGAADGESFRNEAMKLVSEKCFDGRFSAAQESAARSWLAQMAATTLESVADMTKPWVSHTALYLAELYELGLGVEQDRAKAIYWYQQSAALGLYAAQQRLKELGIDWKHA
jgi:TPR repeat protein